MSKLALDPNRAVAIRPYLSDEATGLDLTVHGVSTIEPCRTFWDKIMIARGPRRFYERYGNFRNKGERDSRHYYGLHCMLNSDIAMAALNNIDLGADCAKHARIEGILNGEDCDK